MNYEGAKTYILNRLKTELPSNLYYHSFEHTFDVLRICEMYGNEEGLNNEDLSLLCTAALYHDSGFVIGYENHEAISVEIANNALKNFGYSSKQIKTVRHIIMATMTMYQPVDLMQQIMCDADLDYLGREDYFFIAQKLKVELVERGFLSDEKDWLTLQIHFLKKHQYYTKSAILLRNEQKQKNYQELLNELNGIK